jgi:hypothetical protein
MALYARPIADEALNMWQKSFETYEKFQVLCELFQSYLYIFFVKTYESFKAWSGYSCDHVTPHVSNPYD